VFNILFFLVPAFTSSVIPLKLEQKIRTLIKIIKKNRYKLTITIKCDKITHIVIRTLVEDTTLVGTLLPQSVLHHNLLLTLAACNEREVWPQSLWNPMRG
jgi:hypothetical protein